MIEGWHKSQVPVYHWFFVVTVISGLFVLGSLSVSSSSPDDTRFVSLRPYMMFTSGVAASGAALILLVAPTAIRFDSRVLAVRFRYGRVTQAQWSEVRDCRYNQERHVLWLVLGRFAWNLKLRPEVGMVVVKMFTDSRSSGT